MAEILDSSWLVAGVAFVLGLFVGWMAWGRPWGEDNGSDKGKSPDGVRNGIIPAKATSEDKLALLAAEIQKARSEMDAADESDAAIGAELDKLDQAVKRANGRLKLILKSADRAQDSQ